MNPVELARSLAFGECGEPQHTSVGCKNHNELIFGWDAHDEPRDGKLGPAHGRRAAHIDFVPVGNDDMPGNEQVAPFVEPTAGLIENLHPGVISVRHVKPTLRIGGNRMRQTELSASNSQASPRRHKLPVAVEMNDPVVAIAVRYKKITATCDRHIRGTVQVRGIFAGLSWRAESEQQFSIRRYFRTQCRPLSTSHTSPWRSMRT